VANVPIAVMSGAIDLEQQAAAMGAVATLAKPLDVELLIDIVKRYCA
jgi:DNA-binding NtrC family response regulator